MSDKVLLKELNGIKEACAGAQDEVPHEARTKD